MARKSFVEGQEVQVCIRTALGSVWCRARYARTAGTPGVHWVWRGGQQLEYASRNARPMKAGAK